MRTEWLESGSAVHKIVAVKVSMAVSGKDQRPVSVCFCGVSTSVEVLQLSCKRVKLGLASDCEIGSWWEDLPDVGPDEK